MKIGGESKKKSYASKVASVKRICFEISRIYVFGSVEINEVKNTSPERGRGPPAAAAAEAAGGGARVRARAHGPPRAPHGGLVFKQNVF